MKNIFGLLALSLAIALLLFAQTPSDYLTTRCGAGAASASYLLWTGQAPYPLCLAIGPTLKVSTVNGHAQLDAVAPAAPRAWSQLSQSADGSYLVFNPAASIFRNGLFQTPVLDYTVSGSTLTPVAGAPWAADDVVTAVF